MPAKGTEIKFKHKKFKILQIFIYLKHSYLLRKCQSKGSAKHNKTTLNDIKKISYPNEYNPYHHLEIDDNFSDKELPQLNS